ncbi:MAG: hypothetical protein KI792_08205 [Alphaproteobacteria bacterium]|nr:hypothetical protein [Alphaproteobacteria bacterium SS10]
MITETASRYAGNVLLGTVIGLSWGLSALAQDKTPVDLSFVPPPDGVIGGDDRPPLMPRLAGDMAYLSSLPVAQRPVYDRLRGNRGCTNKLDAVSYAVRVDSDFSVLMKIPPAFLEKEPAVRKDDGMVSRNIRLFVTLPDFRPSCLRDKVADEKKHETGVADVPSSDYSSTSVTLAFESPTQAITRVDRLIIQAKEIFEPYGSLVPDKDWELWPGMETYVYNPANGYHPTRSNSFAFIPLSEKWASKVIGICNARDIARGDFRRCTLSYQHSDFLSITVDPNQYWDQWAVMLPTLGDLIEGWIIETKETEDGG